MNLPATGSQRVHVRLNQIDKKSTLHIRTSDFTFPIRSPLENGWYGMSLNAVGILQGPQPSGLSWISGETKCALPSILSCFLIQSQAYSLVQYRDIEEGLVSFHRDPGLWWRMMKRSCQIFMFLLLSWKAKAAMSVSFCKWDFCCVIFIFMRYLNLLSYLLCWCLVNDPHPH